MLGTARAMTTLPAENLGRAIKFYTEILGLKLLMTDQGVAIFEAGEGSQIFIYERARTIAEHTALTFVVKDIEEVVKNLAGKGVKFEQYDLGDIKTNEIGVAEAGPNKIAWLTDPEGNIVAISSM